MILSCPYTIWFKSYSPMLYDIDYIIYTRCTVKLRPNFSKKAQLKCTSNEKRNLSERDEKN